MKHNDLVFDVGMHKGEDTEFYLAKGFRVVAFEANPDLAASCRKRFARLIANGRLTIVEGAIVEKAIIASGQKTVRFYQNQNASIWGTTKPDWAQRNEVANTRSSTIEVPVIDLTKCFNQYGIPYYLKIDIEGADTTCLRFLLDFEVKPSWVSIEAEKVSFDRLRGEIDLLDQLGYSQFQAVQQSTISSQLLPQPAKEGKYVPHRFDSDASGPFGKELPGRWRSKAEIIRQYRIIFIGYKLFGDNSLLLRSPIGRLFIRALTRMFRQAIPGWHDTHARHSSVSE